MLHIHYSIESIFKEVNNIVPNLFYNIKVITDPKSPRIIINVPESFIDDVEKSFEDNIVVILDDDGKQRISRIEVKNGMS